jgi:hypothetical protein
VVVAARRLDLEDPVAELEDGDVERAAAEVEDEDGLAPSLCRAVGKSRSRRLIDNALDVEAGDLAGVLCRLALGVLEVRRDRDDGLVTSSPRYSSASLLSFCRVIAEISGGE